MHIETSDPSFIDVLISHHAGRNDRLERIDRLIDCPKSPISSTTSTPPPKADPPTPRS